MLKLFIWITIPLFYYNVAGEITLLLYNFEKGIDTYFHCECSMVLEWDGMMHKENTTYLL
jgi:hypothetical protein